MQESRYCDAGCMLSGGVLEERIDEEFGSSWSECSYGEDLELCRYPYETDHGLECDNWCAPNNGVRHGHDCWYENIYNGVA